MKALLALLRSMRFAIAILAVVAIAATIGSVLEQNQASAVYVGRYGQVWARFYALSGLTDIYHSWWFFLLLGFMATSTGLCLWQNTPGMLRDMRSYREHKSVASLRQLAHSAELALIGPPAALQARLQAYLARNGYACKPVTHDNGTLLLAARRGAARRAGYLLVHGAMVLICIGGLVDGNVGLRIRLWSGAARIETRELAPEAVPAASRLPSDAGSFRASMTVPEGDGADSALLPMGDGYLLQTLPFSVHLKQFRVAHYGNGQPKDFTSEIEIHDGPRVLPVTLQVNKPYTYRGVTLYQSGFGDGGSSVALDLITHAGTRERIDAKVGGAHALLLDGQPYTLELVELRQVNVFARDDAPVTLAWQQHSQPGARVHDVGASLAFRLRDQLGQADDWLLYQRPALIDGASWFLVGRRSSEQTAMRYLRLPADSQASLDSYRRFTVALADPAARRRAARALAQASTARLADLMEASANGLLDAFAQRGYRGLADMVPAGASEQEQIRAGRLFASLLERAAAQLEPALAPAFVHDSLGAYSDALDAHLPALFQFVSYQPVNASVLQLTRAPGALLVYLGAALLLAGVCAMYFVPERRLWLHLDGQRLLLALTSNRPSPALQAEFDLHHSALGALIAQ